MSSHDIAIEQYDRIDDLIADKLRERQIKIQTMVCQTDLPDRLPARLAAHTFWSLLLLLLMLLGSVALAVAVAFAFAVAVAVTDIRLTRLIRPIRLYKPLSLPFFC